ncbi:hypothetical protein RHDE110596_05335 [Prescottella defluvii]|uniref:hypothetical protein n=1 Tax=Prescottella defluvii TaxID=1323361 RepID=UPI0004F2F213|nr:hypothetical protein [Prescottella defluvii]
MDSPTGERVRHRVSRIASRPTPYWVFGVVVGYYSSERMSWESGETSWESALEWSNLPFFAVLTGVFVLGEVAYRKGRFLTLRALAPAPFILFQLRFALWLLYYPIYWLFWLGLAGAIALTVAAVMLGQPRRS